MSEPFGPRSKNGGREATGHGAHRRHWSGSARADAAAYIALTMAIVVLPDLVSSERVRRVTSRGVRLAYPVVIGVMSAYWFLSVEQSKTLTEGFTQRSGDVHGLTVWWANILNLPYLWAGAFGVPPGGLGWLDTMMPPLVWFTILGTVLLLIVRSLRCGSRSTKQLLGLLGFIASVLPLWVLAKSTAVLPAEVQQRYVLPALFVLMGVSLSAATCSDARPFHGNNMLWVAGAVSLANSLALHTNLRRYVTGVDTFSPNLDASIEWWWVHAFPSPMVCWLLGSIGLAVAAFGAIWLTSHAGRQSSQTS